MPHLLLFSQNPFWALDANWILAKETCTASLVSLLGTITGANRFLLIARDSLLPRSQACLRLQQSQVHGRGAIWQTDSSLSRTACMSCTFLEKVCECVHGKVALSLQDPLPLFQTPFYFSRSWCRRWSNERRHREFFRSLGTCGWQSWGIHWKTFSAFRGGSFFARSCCRDPWCVWLHF